MAGGVSVRTDQGTWQAGPGEWVFLLPGRRHQAFQPGTRIWSICYRTGLPRNRSWYAEPGILVLGGHAELSAAGEALVAQAEAITGARPLGERFDFDCTPITWLRLDAAFRAWLATAMSALEDRGIRLSISSRSDARVDRALALISRDPWAAAAAPGPVAAALGVSRRRLEQLFQAGLGHGIAEARDRLRVDAAEAILDDHAVAVKQVAARLGFASSQVFSAWFHRHAGMTPRSYRAGLPGDA
jgi:AraC-like DNA-binding protein